MSARGHAFLACAALLGALAAHGQPARVALVIGNAAYPNAPLANPVNDARAVSAALREAGFQVIERHDASAVEMRRAIRDFGERLANKDAGVFYYAGHGVQVNGRNFLVPVSADIRYEDEIEDQSVDVGLVLAKMGGARSRTNLLILDACRNNPFSRGTRGLGGGLAPIEAPIGTLVAFATSPGQVASDGSGDNGLYTTHLVREMRQPGLKVEDVFKRVRAAVRQASAGRQIPWENTSLEGDFYFRAPLPAAHAEDSREAKLRQEQEIQRQVAEAVTRSRAEAEGERRKLEAFYTKRIEEERAAAQSEAAVRIAAIERQVAEAAARPAPSLAALQPARVEPPRPTPPRPAADEPEDLNKLVLLSMALPTALPTPPEPVALGLEPPTLVVGDSWTYFREIRDAAKRRHYVSHEVKRADAAGTVIDTSDGKPIRLGPAGELVSYPAGPNESVTWDPPEPRMPFPLEPGKRWTSQGKQRQATSSADTDTVTTVLGWEELTVPAGTFRALKLVKVTERRRELFPGQAVTSKLLDTQWYVPALKREARREVLEVAGNGRVDRDEIWELDSYRLH